MRKIEQQIISAIQNNQDLKVANSEVISCTMDGKVLMTYIQYLTFTVKAWHRHVTGYYETKYPHIPGMNQKQFWNIINGNK